VRLLFLACDFPPAFGGIQKLNHGLCRALVALGHNVHVIATAQPGAGDFDRVSPVPTLRFPAGGRLGSALSLGRVVRREMAADFAPDAIIATKWSPEAHGYLASRRRDVPMILMGYGREFLPERTRPVRALAQRAVLRAAAGAIVISRYTADQMTAAGLARDRIRIVPPGVDPDEFRPVPDLDAARRETGFPTAPTLLTIARLVRRKGIDTVIQSLPLLAERIPQVQYVVIGGGEDQARLAGLADQLGVADRVHFLGSMSDAHKAACLQLCDVFVMPSRDIPSEPPEGFGIVYLEANLCGKPVIAARTGGVEDAVENGLNGLLVEPDRPDQVAEAATRLLANPEDAGRMGERGRQRALTHFTWEAIAPQFVTAVQSLIA